MLLTLIGETSTGRRVALDAERDIWVEHEYATGYASARVVNGRFLLRRGRERRWLRWDDVVDRFGVPVDEMLDVDRLFAEAIAA